VSRVESGKNGQGRVQGLFLPGSTPGAAPQPNQPAQGARPNTGPIPLRPF
jgi:hypothetical protein